MRTTITDCLDELASLHTHPPLDCGLRSVSMTKSTMSLQGQAEQPMVLRGLSVSSTVPNAKGLTLGRGWRAECGFQLGGWGRCALAPLRSYAACWPGGHRGWAVWPFQGSRGLLMAALGLWRAGFAVLSV